MAVRFQCPCCKKELELEENECYEGHKLQCPTCGNLFAISNNFFQQDSAPLTDFAPPPPNASFPDLQDNSIPEQNMPALQPGVLPRESDNARSSMAKWCGAICILLVLLILVLVIGITIVCKRLSNVVNQVEELPSAVAVEDRKSSKPVTVHTPPINAYKIINYSWDYHAMMENEFSKAIKEGYEPAGYVCKNGIKGGFFLFVKRK